MTAPMKERYEAAMVLSGTGDSLGYKNGSWEFCHSGVDIYKELQSLGGLNKVNIKRKIFMYCLGRYTMELSNCALKTRRSSQVENPIPSEQKVNTMGYQSWQNLRQTPIDFCHLCTIATFLLKVRYLVNRSIHF